MNEIDMLMSFGDDDGQSDIDNLLSFGDTETPEELARTQEASDYQEQLREGSPPIQEDASVPGVDQKNVPEDESPFELDKPRHESTLPADSPSSSPTTGSYTPTSDDLEAAGYTPQEIDKVDAIAEDARAANELGPETDPDKLSLGAPSTDMYNGLKMGNPEDAPEKGTQTTAWGLYNFYINQEGTEQDSLGNYYYKGNNDTWYQIYPPEDDHLEAITGEGDATNGEDYPAGVGLESVITAGINNAGTDLLEFGSMIADTAVMAGQKITGNEATGLGATEWVGENLGRTSSGSSDLDQLIMDGTAFGLGFLGGNAGGKVVVNGVEYTVKGLATKAGKFKALSPKTALEPVLEETVEGVNTIAAKIPFMNKKNWETLMGAVGGEVGMVSTTSSDTPTFLMGEDGLFGVDAGMLWGLDPEDPKAMQVLNARLNILADAAIMVFGTETLIRGGMKATGAVKNVMVNGITNRILGGEKSAQTRAVQSVLDELAEVVATSTGKDLDAARSALADAIRENRELILEGAEADGAGTLVFDTLTAMEGGEFPPEVIARIRGMQKGALGSGKERLIAAVDTPTAQIQKEINYQHSNSLSEGNSLQNVADEVVNTQNSRLGAADAEVAELEAALENADVNAIREILKSERFEPHIQNITNADPSEVGRMSDDALQKLARGVREEVSSLLAHKNELFDAIPEGDPFDYRGFGVALGEATKNSNAFDGSGSEFIKLRLLNVLKEGIENASGVQLSQLKGYSGESVAELSDIMQNQGIDFKTLFTKIRPEIAALREEAAKQGKAGVADRLSGLLKHIDENQIDWLETKKYSKSAEAATRAMDNYQYNYAPLAKDGNVEKVEASLKNNSYVDRNTGERVINRPVSLSSDTKDIVEKTVHTGRQEEINQLSNLLRGKGSDVDSTAIEEYMIADFFNKLYINVRSNSGVGKLDEATVAKLVQDMGTQIRALGTDSVLGAELDAFSNKILAAKGDRETIISALNSAQKRADAVRQDAFSVIIEPFINKAAKEGDNLIATGNPDAALKSFITGDNGVDNVRRLMEETEGNEIIREGLEQAYFKELQSAMMGTTQTMGGEGYVFKPGAVKALLHGDSAISAVGLEIFKDNPKKLKLIKSIISLAEKQTGSVGTRAVKGASGTAELQAYQSTVNNLIYATVGPLNKLGTKIRAVSNVLANYADITKAFDRAMDMVLADSALFSEIADGIVSRQGTVGVGKMRIDKGSADAMFSLAVRAGLYSESDEQREQYDGLLGQVFELEKTIGSAASSVGRAVGSVTESISDALPQ